MLSPSVDTLKGLLREVAKKRLTLALLLRFLNDMDGARAEYLSIMAPLYSLYLSSNIYSLDAIDERLNSIVAEWEKSYQDARGLHRKDPLQTVSINASSVETEVSQPTDSVAKPQPAQRTKNGLTKKEIISTNWPIPDKISLDRLLSDVPKWLLTARMSRGRPGKCSSLWSPAQLATCLVSERRCNKLGLEKHIHNFYPEWVDDWNSLSQYLDV